MAADRPVFNLKTCMACRICVSICPVSVLIDDLTGQDMFNKAYPRLHPAEACIGCGICAKECPVDAITMVSIRS